LGRGRGEKGGGGRGGFGGGRRENGGFPSSPTPCISHRQGKKDVREKRGKREARDAPRLLGFPPVAGGNLEEKKDRCNQSPRNAYGAFQLGERKEGGERRRKRQPFTGAGPRPSLDSPVLSKGRKKGKERGEEREVFQEKKKKSRLFGTHFAERGEKEKARGRKGEGKIPTSIPKTTFTPSK